MLDSYYYSQYIFKYDMKTTEKDIESGIAKVRGANRFSFQNLTTLSADEKYKKLQAVILAERGRNYLDGGMDFYIRILKFSHRCYIAVLSVNEGVKAAKPDLLPSLLKGLFGREDYEQAVLSGIKQESERSAKSYWARTFRSFEYKGYRDLPESKGKRIRVCVPMSSETGKLLSGYSGNKAALLNHSLGILIGRKDIDSKKVIINNVHEGGKLSCAPVFLNTSDDMSQVARIRDQITSIDYNSSVDTDYMLRLAGDHFRRRAALTFGFFSGERYEEFTKKLDTGIVYCINAINTVGAPICIWVMEIEGEYSVSFNFDTVFEDGINPEETVMFLETILNHLLGGKADSKSLKRASAEYLSSGDNSYNLKLEILKRKSLRAISMFKSYSNEEIDALAEKFSLSYRYSEQDVVSAGSKMDNLYIILSGSVMVLGRNRKSYVNPLFRLKPGSILCIEGVASSAKSNVDYRVLSKNAVLLSIPVKDFRKEAQAHPMLMRYLLQIQSERLAKMEKLWLTV